MNIEVGVCAQARRRAPRGPRQLATQSSHQTMSGAAQIHLAEKSSAEPGRARSSPTTSKRSTSGRRAIARVASVSTIRPAEELARVVGHEQERAFRPVLVPRPAQDTPPPVLGNSSAAGTFTAFAREPSAGGKVETSTIVPGL